MKRILILVMVLVAGLEMALAEDNASEKSDIAILKRTGKAFTGVAKKAIPGVVAITGEMDVEYVRPRYNGGLREWYYGQQGMDVYRRQVKQGGSGFIISEDGYILTNSHVIKGADRIKVRLNDGRIFEAQKIGADPRSEVAVIKIKGSDLPALELGDSSELEIGEWAIAIGNPFGFFSESLTVGVISAKGRSNLALAEYEDFIQTDAAINPGNSGGPLLNIDGQVVGINTAIYSESGGYMGIGFAIPINMAKSIADQLIENDGQIVRGYMGVRFNPRDIDAKLAESFGMKKAEGALIAEVIDDTPADKAGVKAGDVILEINGKRIEGIKALTSTAALLPPGTKTRVKVFRKGAEKELSMVMGAFPGDDIKSGDAKGLAAHIGLSVAELTPELAARFGYTGTKGVIVSEVEPRSLAAQTELLPGLVIMSVNRTPISSVTEFNDALKDSLKTRRVILRVRSPEYSWFVLIPLE